jgi:hypothetical protein
MLAESRAEAEARLDGAMAAAYPGLDPQTLRRSIIASDPAGIFKQVRAYLMPDWTG